MLHPPSWCGMGTDLALWPQVRQHQGGARPRREVWGADSGRFSAGQRLPVLGHCQPGAAPSSAGTPSGSAPVSAISLPQATTCIWLAGRTGQFYPLLCFGVSLLKLQHIQLLKKAKLFKNNSPVGKRVQGNADPIPLFTSVFESCHRRGWGTEVRARQQLPSARSPSVSMAAPLLVREENREVPSKRFLFLAFPARSSRHSFHRLVLGARVPFPHRAGSRLAPDMAAGWGLVGGVWSGKSVRETDRAGDFVTPLSLTGLWIGVFCWENTQARFLQAFLTSPWAPFNWLSSGMTQAEELGWQSRRTAAASTAEGPWSSGIQDVVTRWLSWLSSSQLCYLCALRCSAPGLQVWKQSLGGGDRVQARLSLHCREGSCGRRSSFPLGSSVPDGLEEPICMVWVSARRGRAGLVKQMAARCFAPLQHGSL